MQFIFLKRTESKRRSKLKKSLRVDVISAMHRSARVHACLSSTNPNGSIRDVKKQDFRRSARREKRQLQCRFICNIRENYTRKVHRMIQLQSSIFSVTGLDPLRTMTQTSFSDPGLICNNGINISYKIRVTFYSLPDAQQRRE